MAKVKYADNLIGMKCKTCKRRNYYMHRNKKKVTRKIELKKYCQWCRVQTTHNETRLTAKSGL